MFISHFFLYGAGQQLAERADVSAIIHYTTELSFIALTKLIFVKANRKQKRSQSCNYVRSLLVFPVDFLSFLTIKLRSSILCHPNNSSFIGKLPLSKSVSTNSRKVKALQEVVYIFVATRIKTLFSQ